MPAATKGNSVTTPSGYTAMIPVSSVGIVPADS